MTSVERTLLVVMPDAMQHSEAIIALVDSLGFYVTSSKLLKFTKERAHQYFYSTSFTEAQMEHLCSAPVQCLVLSKVGAISALINLVGGQYDEPADARDFGPQSLRALYGTDRARCGVRCSLSSEDARREISCVFPSAPLHQRSTEEYLQETILPGLAEALCEISQQRPSDPFEKLQQWLLRHRPSTETLYENPVLKGYKLKADGGVNRTETIVPGVRNFRRCGGAAPIYGMAQADTMGMEAVAQYLLEEQGHTSAVFINIREEPVIFVDGVSYTIRHPQRPFINVQHFAAVAGHELASIERRLAMDVRGLGTASGGAITILGSDGEPESRVVVPSTLIQAMSEAYDSLTKKYPTVSFQRIPFPDGQNPDDEDVDDLIEAVRTLPKGGCIVIQCDNGKGRTTQFMAIADLVWSELARNRDTTLDQGALTPEISSPALTPSLTLSASHAEYSRHASSYSSVQVLLGSLEKGRSALLPAVENACRNTSHLFYLGSAVSDALEAAQNYSTDNKIVKVHAHKGNNSTMWMSMATTYLKRYCMLIVIAAYLGDHSPSLRKTFREWHRKHWNVELPIRSIRFNE